MSTHAPSNPPKRRGLPRPFVAVSIVLGVLVGAYAVLALLSIATASTEHRTRTFPAGEQLRVEASAEDVTIFGEQRRDVRVEMEIQRGMFRGASQPSVRVRQEDGRLVLESHCSLLAHIGVSDCGASFVVRVPRDMLVAVGASSGDVRIARMTADVAVEASSGDVRADDDSGRLRIGASSGDVTVERYGGADVSADTGSGDVEMRTVRVPTRLRVKASSGDVKIGVPDATYDVSVETGSGDERVDVSKDANAPRVIDVEASSGDVTVERLGDAR